MASGGRKPPDGSQQGAYAPRSPRTKHFACNEPLEPLRGRDDFQKLLKKPEGKTSETVRPTPEPPGGSPKWLGASLRRPQSGRRWCEDGPGGQCHEDLVYSPQAQQRRPRSFT